MSNNSGGRKRDVVWLSFNEIKLESRKGIRAECKSCKKELEGQVVRMRSHLLKCKGKGRSDTNENAVGKLFDFIHKILKLLDVKMCNEKK